MRCFTFLCFCYIFPSMCLSITDYYSVFSILALVRYSRPALLMSRGALMWQPTRVDYAQNRLINLNELYFVFQNIKVLRKRESYSEIKIHWNLFVTNQVFYVKESQQACLYRLLIPSIVHRHTSSLVIRFGLPLGQYIPGEYFCWGIMKVPTVKRMIGVYATLLGIESLWDGKERLNTRFLCSYDRL